MCDEISTEWDASRVNSLNSSTISSRTTGSSPFVGSSSKRELRVVRERRGDRNLHFVAARKL